MTAKFAKHMLLHIVVDDNNSSLSTRLINARALNSLLSIWRIHLNWIGPRSSFIAGGSREIHLRNCQITCC